MRQLDIPAEALQNAQQVDFDLQAYQFRARQEQHRKPRKVKIGLIQNSIKAPTTAPYAEQTKVPCHAFFDWQALLDSASSSGC